MTVRDSVRTDGVARAQMRAPKKTWNKPLTTGNQQDLGMSNDNDNTPDAELIGHRKVEITVLVRIADSNHQKGIAFDIRPHIHAANGSLSLEAQ